MIAPIEEVAPIMKRYLNDNPEKMLDSEEFGVFLETRKEEIVAFFMEKEDT